MGLISAGRFNQVDVTARAVIDNVVWVNPHIVTTDVFRKFYLTKNMLVCKGYETACELWGKRAVEVTLPSGAKVTWFNEGVAEVEPHRPPNVGEIDKLPAATGTWLFRREIL